MSAERTTVNTFAYESLRKSIINLVYKPGQELNINAIAEELDVSRSPVRDALLQLERDKLVDIFPQRGTRVSFLDREIIKQERFMRLNLELGALSSCMDKLKDSSAREIFVTQLNGNMLLQHAALLSKNVSDFLEYDDELHHMFYSTSGYEWIWSVLSAHTGNEHRIRILSYNTVNITDNVEEEHKELVDAISRNDKERALSIDKIHLTKLYDEIETIEKNSPEYFHSI